MRTQTLSLLLMMFFVMFTVPPVIGGIQGDTTYPMTDEHQSLLSFGEKKVKKQELQDEENAVQELWKKLNKKERRFLNDLLWENFAAGYYSVLDGFSHHDYEVGHLKRITDEKVRDLQKNPIYFSIIRKAKRGEKELLLRHVIRRRNFGSNYGFEVNAQNMFHENTTKGVASYELRAQNIFVEIKPLKPSRMPSFSFSVPPAKVFAWAAVGLLFTGTIVILMGSAFFADKNKLFQGVRTLLEQ